MGIVACTNMLVNRLRFEGPRSKRAFALFCVARVAHLNRHPIIVECLDVVRRRVADPASVTDIELKRVSAAIDAFDLSTATSAAIAVAYAAAYAADPDADAFVSAAAAAVRAAFAGADDSCSEAQEVEWCVQEAWAVFANGFVSFPS